MPTDPMKRDEATARPWKLVDDTNGVIIGADDYDVALTDAWNVATKRTSDENRANAELIVTAVNERPTLLAALEEAKKVLEDIAKYSYHPWAANFARDSLSKLNEAVDGK